MLMLIDAYWCLLMLIDYDADWFWVMLNDADRCSNPVNQIFSERTSGLRSFFFKKFPLLIFNIWWNPSYLKHMWAATSPWYESANHGQTVSSSLQSGCAGQQIGAYWSEATNWCIFRFPRRQFQMFWTKWDSGARGQISTSINHILHYL